MRVPSLQHHYWPLNRKIPCRTHLDSPRGDKQQNDTSTGQHKHTKIKPSTQPLVNHKWLWYKLRHRSRFSHDTVIRHLVDAQRKGHGYKFRHRSRFNHDTVIRHSVYSQRKGLGCITTKNHCTSQKPDLPCQRQSDHFGCKMKEHLGADCTEIQRIGAKIGQISAIWSSVASIAKHCLEFLISHRRTIFFWVFRKSNMKSNDHRPNRHGPLKYLETSP